MPPRACPCLALGTDAWAAFRSSPWLASPQICRQTCCLGVPPPRNAAQRVPVAGCHRSQLLGAWPREACWRRIPSRHVVARSQQPHSHPSGARAGTLAGAVTGRGSKAAALTKRQHQQHKRTLLWGPRLCGAWERVRTGCRSSCRASRAGAVLPSRRRCPLASRRRGVPEPYQRPSQGSSCREHTPALAGAAGADRAVAGLAALGLRRRRSAPGAGEVDL